MSGVAEDVDGQHPVVRAECGGIGEPDRAGGTAAVQKEDRGWLQLGPGVDAGDAVRSGKVNTVGPPASRCPSVK